MNRRRIVRVPASSANLGPGYDCLAAALSLHLELEADVYPHAVEIEGHPDNVAAALLGGLVICTPDGAQRFDPAPGLEGVIAIPPGQVPTHEARAALPATVPITDAVHNIAHASM